MPKDLFGNEYHDTSNVVILKAKHATMTVTKGGNGDFTNILAQNIQHSTSRQSKKISVIGTPNTFSASLPSQGQLSIERVVSDVPITSIFGEAGTGCWINQFDIKLSVNKTPIAEFKNCKIVSLGGRIDANNPTIAENVAIMCGTRTL